MEIEKSMLQILQKYTKSHSEIEKKSAGDLRIWIFLRNKEGKSFNVEVSQLTFHLHNHVVFLFSCFFIPTKQIPEK